MQRDTDDRLAAHTGYRGVLRLTLMTDWQLTRVITWHRSWHYWQTGSSPGLSWGYRGWHWWQTSNSRRLSWDTEYDTDDTLAAHPGCRRYWRWHWWQTGSSLGLSWGTQADTDDTGGSPGLSGGIQAHIADGLALHPGCRGVLRLKLTTEWQLTQVIVGVPKVTLMTDWQLSRLVYHTVALL